MTRVLQFASATILFGFLSACGPQTGDDATAVSAEPVINGTAYSGHPAMMKFLTRGPGWYSTCTATLIAPRKLLTAAHCVEDWDATQRDFVSNLQKPNVDQAAQWAPVQKVEIHPAWAAQQYINEGHDCAILTLEQEYPGVTPIPVNLDETAVVRNMPVTLLGYGNNVAGSGAGTKRIGFGTVQDIYDGVYGAAGPTQTTCQCDSGGGLLAKIGNVEKVIGVTSYGSFGCVGLGYSTNVAKTCKAFIEPHLATQPPVLP